MDASATPLPALLAANRRLYALRSQAAGHSSAALPGMAENSAGEAPKDEYGGQPFIYGAVRATLPAHLGWGSGVLTAVLRREPSISDTNTAQTQADPATAALSSEAAADLGGGNCHPAKGSGGGSSLDAWVKLYPDIGLGMLRRELTAPGRLWLLLRYLDAKGRGSFRIVLLEEQITDQNSPYYLCGRRQLRNLLKAGEGIFWQRERDRLWLRAAAKVAYSLGVTRLTGRPVAFPLAVLLCGIGQFRAELYAAFHSGRVRSCSNSRRTKPISRRTLANLSGVGRSSQRSYERQARIAVSSNFAVGETASDKYREERAWQKGTAVFTLTDHQGQQGPAGRPYLAWQLPNSYAGRHQQRPKGRQRRINRQLKDLVMQGMPGNVDRAMAASQMATRLGNRIFHRNGGEAAKAHGRRAAQDHYWPSGQRVNLWHVISKATQNW
jgi:hypothetical protein